ncbi:MAG TPA: hypothetical protein VHV57_21085 [Acidimicrobiales bacterium]|nr:hypothetical protein [Acidimicrobiales bacterium]
MLPEDRNKPVDDGFGGRNLDAMAETFKYKLVELDRAGGETEVQAAERILNLYGQDGWGLDRFYDLGETSTRYFRVC